MNYFKGTISAFAALFVTLVAPGPWSPFRGISGEKATGLAVIVASVLSPWFWLAAIIVFSLFFAASRLQNKSLRVLLFWLPAGTTSVLMVAFAAFMTYVLLQIRHS